MIHTIAVACLLREAVRSPYRNLVTRPTGVAVRGRIEQAVRDSGCLSALLDFDGVELLDFSCADEVVAKLVQAGTVPGAVAVRGLRDDQREAIDHVLAHQRLACVELHGAEPHGAAPGILGDPSEDLRLAFDELRRAERLDAPALAERLDWSVGRAGEALDLLERHHLARRADTFHLPYPLA